MAKFKLNHFDEYESIGTFKLSKERTPIAFQNKVDELVEEGMSVEDAEKFVSNTEFELEIYYQQGWGLFAVQTDIVENCEEIMSPYNGDVARLEPREDE